MFDLFPTKRQREGAMWIVVQAARRSIGLDSIMGFRGTDVNEYCVRHITLMQIVILQVCYRVNCLNKGRN